MTRSTLFISALVLGAAMAAGAPQVHAQGPNNAEAQAANARQLALEGADSLPN